MDQLRVIKAGTPHMSTWDAYITDHPDGTVYHSSRWLLDGPHGESALVLAYDNENLIGGFAYTVNTTRGFRRILKPALTARFAPLVTPSLSDAQKVQVYDAIFKAIKPYDLIGLATTNTDEAELMRTVLGASKKVYPTNIKTLPDTADELLASYQNGIRRNIKQALIEGGKLVEEADTDEAYRLFTSAYSSRGDIPRFSLDQFTEVYERMKWSGEVTLPGVVDQNGLLVGALLLLYDQKRAFYVVSGTDRDALGGNTGALLMHFALRFAQDRNLLFDFNGSSISGINSFFERFRPEPASVSHIRYAASLKGKLALLFEPVIGRNVI
jgi:hypothetical protein